VNQEHEGRRGNDADALVLIGQALGQIEVKVDLLLFRVARILQILNAPGGDLSAAEEAAAAEKLKAARKPLEDALKANQPPKQGA
jgi:hypothetical protein